MRLKRIHVRMQTPADEMRKRTLREVFEQHLTLESRANPFESAMAGISKEQSFCNLRNFQGNL